MSDQPLDPKRFQAYIKALRNFVERAERAARIQPRDSKDTARLELVAAAKRIAENANMIRPDPTWPAALRRDASDVRQAASAILVRNGWHRIAMSESIGADVERRGSTQSTPLRGTWAEATERRRTTPAKIRRVSFWKFQAPEDRLSGDAGRAAEWKRQCAPMPEELAQLQTVLRAFEIALNPRAAAQKTLDPILDARNEFLYVEIVVKVRPEKVVRAEASKVEGWPKLGSRQATYKAIDAYAKDHGITLTRKRAAGRPRKSRQTDEVSTNAG